MSDIDPGDFVAHQWCPGCSKEVTSFQGNCPTCGTLTEETGTGDDDPYPEDPFWREKE